MAGRWVFSRSAAVRDEERVGQERSRGCQAAGARGGATGAACAAVTAVVLASGFAAAEQCQMAHRADEGQPQHYTVQLQFSMVVSSTTSTAA